MDKLIVTITGILSIAGIYWFFFGKKEESMEASDTWTITVDGGYKPNVIKIPTAICTSPMILGVKRNVEPKSPRKNPRIT